MFFFYKSISLDLLQENKIKAAVSLCQSGNNLMRETLINDYKPFIARVIKDVCKRYISPEDDEFSVGLMAFNEAIDSYKPEHGKSFLAFASLVIKRRLIDYFRRQNGEIPFSQFENNEKVLSKVEHVQSLKVHTEKNDTWERKQEIKQLSFTLLKFDITFNDLVKTSPSHQKTRSNCLKTALAIVKNKNWQDRIFKYGTLTIKEISIELQVSKKTLERHRKYIIAVFLILLGDYPYLKDFLKLKEDGK